MFLPIKETKPNLPLQEMLCFWTQDNSMRVTSGKIYRAKSDAQRIYIDQADDGKPTWYFLNSKCARFRPREEKSLKETNKNHIWYAIKASCVR